MPGAGGFDVSQLGQMLTQLGQMLSQALLTLLQLGAAFVVGLAIMMRALRRVLDESRARGKRGIVCSSLATMRAAHRIYERLGFERAPERDWSEGNPPYSCKTRDSSIVVTGLSLPAYNSSCRCS